MSFSGKLEMTFYDKHLFTNIAIKREKDNVNIALDAKFLYDITSLALAKALPDRLSTLTMFDSRIGSAEIVDSTKITYKDLYFDAGLSRSSDVLNLYQRRFTLSAKSIVLSIKELVDQKYYITLKGLEITELDPSEKIITGIDRPIMTEGDLEIAVKLDITDIDSAIKLGNDIYRELSSFVYTGKIALPIFFEVKLRFKYRDDFISMKMLTVKKDGTYHMRLAPEDVKDIFAKTLKKNIILTDTECDLIADYPLRILRIVEISNFASSVAEEQKGNASDAFRHVIWSYLLAREFGSDFSKMVTDAHEIGSVTNTKDEHIMDYTNNAVGRGYAARELPLSRVLALMRTDPEIIFAAGKTPGTFRPE